MVIYISTLFGPSVALAFYMALCLFRYDPLSLLSVHFSTYENLKYLPLLNLLGVFCVIQGERIYSLTVLSLICTCHTSLSIINLLTTRIRRTRPIYKTCHFFLETLRCFNELKIVASSAEYYITRVTTFYQIGGFFFAVVDGFGAVRMNHLLPFPLNVTPIVSFALVLAVASVMVPMATEVHETSHAFLLQIKREIYHVCGSRNLGLMRRVVQSNKPYIIYSGTGKYHIYENKRGTKISYFEYIMNYVINAILSVPSFSHI